MQTADAFEMGVRSARPGLFFDTMELVAALSVSAGGFDALESFVRTLASLQQQTGEDLTWVTRLCEAAFRAPHPLPGSVDGYRTLLTGSVFEIVNRWSYIGDIHTVTRLQAWFYCGFGLGRAHTVLEGFRFFDDLRNSVGLLSPLDQMPTNLSRMASESARQLSTVAAEDDFARIRPLFVSMATMLDGYSLRLQMPASAIILPPTLADDLTQVAELTRQCRLDYARHAVM